MNKPHHFSFPTLTLVASMSIFGFDALHAERIVTDFESGIGGFTFVDNEGSNAGKFGTVTGVNPDTGAEEGLAANIGDNIAVANNIPGAWLQAGTFSADPSEDFLLEFDFRFEAEGRFDDATFVFGNLTEGNYYSAGLGEAVNSQSMFRFEDGARLSEASIAYGETLLSTAIWYRMTFNWSAGDSTITMNLATTADQDVELFEVTLVLDNSDISLEPLTNFGTLEFGFGTFNDEASYDNIIIDGDGVNESDDSDRDGLPDFYEQANRLNPNDNGSMDINNGPAGDPDGDGLNNIQEFLGLDAFGNSHGFGQTLAAVADSDGDTLNDGEEVSGELHAFRSDVAGTAATMEPGLPTNPNARDSDNDGLTDDEEVSGSRNIANSNAPTNPLTNDTDGDLMDDLYEVTNNLLGGLDPNTDDANGNLDGDLGNDELVFDPLTNIDEYRGDSLGVQTRADMLDTDDDGYDDTVENGVGQWGSVMSTGTSPVNPDTDGDGLLDGQENRDLTVFPGLGIFPTSADPNLTDTDLDNLIDMAEAVDLGTNPLLADSDMDNVSDPAELFLFNTDPANASSVPSNDELQGLRVNFQNESTENAALDFQTYSAQHEVLDSFIPQRFSAFGGTDNIEVSVSWDADGTEVNPEAPQMFSRQPQLEFTPEWPNLLLDWIGTDARRTPGDPLTLVVSGLPAGTYLWTSYHADMLNQTGFFDVTMTTDQETFSTTEIDIIAAEEGGNIFEQVTTYRQAFETDGGDVSVVFDQVNEAGAVTNLFFVMNAFTITNASLPGDELKIVSSRIDTASGDFVVNFEPGGTEFILTSSPNLEEAFTEVDTATLSNSGTTFRIPAAELTELQAFFRIERR